MLDSYRRVLGRPGAFRFSLAALVGRMPLSMTTLAIVLLVSAETGSYGRAGQISASFVIANAVVAIPHGGLLDKLGQGRVLLVDALLFAVSCGVLGRAIIDGWSTPWPHLAAAAAGATMPLVGSAVRARWAHLLRDANDDKQTAFAVEAVADEVVFMSGPAIVTFLATLVSPLTGLVVAVVLGTIGTVALALQRGTEPPRHPRETTSGRRAPMPWGRLATLTLGAASLGSLFGAIEVACVAFAKEQGHAAASGVLLATWAAGSLIAGLLVGAVAWRTSTVRRLRYGVAFLALAMVPTPFIGSIPLMVVVLFVAGFAISPTLIAAITRVEEVAPPSRLNEAMGLIQTGLGAGIAPGAALGGAMIDANGSGAAYAVGVASVAVAVLASLATRDDRVTTVAA